MSWPVRELTSPWVGSPRVGKSASCPVTMRIWTYMYTWHDGNHIPFYTTHILQMSSMYEFCAGFTNAISQTTTMRKETNKNRRGFETECIYRLMNVFWVCKIKPHGALECPFSCTLYCTGHRNDFELIPTVRMESQHSIGAPTGHDFPRFVIISEKSRLEVGNRWRWSRFFGNKNTLKVICNGFSQNWLKVVSSCLLQYKPICVINFDKLCRKMLKSRSLVVSFV